MTRVFLVPLGSKHLDSLRPGVAASVVAERAGNEEIRAHAATVGSDARLRYWGCLPTMKSVWGQMRTGDVALMKEAGTGYFGILGRIGLTAKDQALARRTWQTDSRGRTWEYVFFLEHLRFVRVAKPEVNTAAGYALNDNLASIRRVPDSRAERVRQLITPYLVGELSAEAATAQGEPMRHVAEQPALVEPELRRAAAVPEAFIRDTLYHRPELIEPGLTVTYREYQLGNGRVDLLGRDAGGRPVVIEIKSQRDSGAALAQLLSYMRDLRRVPEWAGCAPRGVLVVGEAEDRLVHAVEELPDITIKVVDIGVTLR